MRNPTRVLVRLSAKWIARKLPHPLQRISLLASPDYASYRTGLRTRPGCGEDSLHGLHTPPMQRIFVACNECNESITKVYAATRHAPPHSANRGGVLLPYF